MPTIDKSSVREQIDDFKKQFEDLRKQGNVSQEICIVFKGLFMVIEVILAVFMEKQTKKTSKNSGKPPSQTEKDNSAIGMPRKKAKDKLDDKKNENKVPTRENTVTLTVSSCPDCGFDLKNISSHACERRTEIDLIVEKKVTHHDAEVKQCPDCHSIVTATFPKAISGPLQYGAHLKAYIINLICVQMVSLNRTQTLVKAMINTTLSEATMLKFVWRLYEALEEWETKAKRALLRATALNMDETSIRVDKKNQWIHSYSHGKTTLKFLHPKRGTIAMDAIGILPSYKGIATHDALAAYFTYTNCEHSLCGSHLLRELVFVIESNHYAWAKNMKQLLQETCQNVTKNKSKCLTEKAYLNIQKRYRNILTRGEKEMPPVLTKPKGKRGKVAKSDAHNLLERLRERETAVLLFAKHSKVSFTNNRAEQDLRMSKVKQKVSGCFRTEKYAKAYCRISSYLQTMANKGYNPLVAIQMALDGNIK